MKLRLTLIVENDSPVSALGNEPENKIKTAWDAMLALISLGSDNGDRGHVETVEILEE